MRILINGFGRSGTTLLRTSLNYHRSITFLDELFHGDMQTRTRYANEGGLRPYSPTCESMINYIHYASETLLQSTPIIGFKILESQYGNLSIEELRVEFDLCFFLARHPLAILVSQLQANQTNEWNRTLLGVGMQGEMHRIQVAKPVKISVAHLERMLIVHRDYIKHRQNLGVIVRYEDLALNFEGCIAGVLKSIGATMQPIKPMTIKLRDWDVYSRIINSDEISKYLEKHDDSGLKLL